ncbi:hypothetical protein ASA1KI_35700 [Opitutales bacterium ASA1]|uniref:class I SAM-dependent methyltransferase n=1 Tax=Congregicoccus parvus TaxID=3081749 RepID=UPI002B31508D|nr:hypothetical protein ASA1KI_35700 [Opitutales bacterium ASA1]
MNTGATLSDFRDYYARRAREYERIYDKPERQPDLSALRTRLPGLLAGRRVYEVACGTGYWTQFVVGQAEFVFATDCNEEVLEVAKTKDLPEERVQWAVADAFDLPPAPCSCDAGLAAFWWSHLGIDGALQTFLAGFFGRLERGARFVFVDNRFVPGSSTPIHRNDAAGNTWQLRRLESGETYEVLKNFPEEPFVRDVLESHARGVHWETLPHYWCAWGEAK